MAETKPPLQVPGSRGSTIGSFQGQVQKSKGAGGASIPLTRCKTTKGFQ